MMESGLMQASFSHSVVMLGFGSIGKAMLLPLPLQHQEIKPEKIKIISRGADDGGLAASFGVEFIARALTEENHESILQPCLAQGDLLLNLSVNVSSLALIEFCGRRGVPGTFP